MTEEEANGTIKYSASEETVVIDDDSIDTNKRSCSENLKRLPRPGTWIILTTETCERFSYYGIKTALVLYLTAAIQENGLGFDKNQAKAHYHAFGMLSYFTGVFGAMMADSKLGKFNTIFWSLFVYCAAEIIITLCSVPAIGNRNPAGPLIGLYLMGTAGGNIKPCVGAFGGEQVDSRDEQLVSKFFALFYMSVNVGAMLTMIIVPIMRTDIKCFGGDCYSAVFGMNTIIIIIGSIAFYTGKNYYVNKPPKGNILVRVSQMIKHALKVRGENLKNGVSYNHWLDHAQDQFGTEEIFEVKELLKVLKMYIFLPFYWCLFHQQGSSWTLQAAQMSGDLGGFEIRADHIQFFNPLLVLIIIPMFDIVIYPAITKCGIDLTPLKKMTAGMILTSIAFVVTGFMQIKIEAVNPSPALPTAGESGIDFINVSPCKMINVLPESFFEHDIAYGESSGYLYGQPGVKEFKVKGTDCLTKDDATSVTTLNVKLEKDQLQSIFIDFVAANQSFTAKTRAQIMPVADVTEAKSRVRIIYVAGIERYNNIDMTLKHKIERKRDIKMKRAQYDASYLKSVTPDEYTILVNTSGQYYEVELHQRDDNSINFGTFGAYTIVLSHPQGKLAAKKVVAHVYVDVEPVVVNRLWQLPQYIIITAGEVLFSVTGLEFAFSQAPQSMKSILQSLWLVTTAFGDFIVIILSVSLPKDLGVVTEMFMYATLMLIVAFIFAFQSYFYVYSDFSGNQKPKPLDEGEEMKGMKSIDSSTQL